MDIKRLHEQGFKVAKIARKLGISRTTVYDYIEKNPDEMAIWLASNKSRRKKLDKYKSLILTWLKEHPDQSSAQIHDWLRERYPSFIIGESTVRSFVKTLREEYLIPKTEIKRQYQAIPDPPMGQQAQVDFGQNVQRTTLGKEIKLYFISFVLSHSRYKYVEWLDRPFTTKDVVLMHENAFKHFEGIPYELVYDQDSLLVVSENAGEIIYTAEFQKYIQERNLQIHLCRKADPESKGRIENVVGYVKKNFAKHRVFHNLEQWNEQCFSWLERTGNGKIHNTTKKRPIEVFSLEKQHLRPVSSRYSPFGESYNPINSIARTVRKDNTILYLSNRYSVPLGTFEKDKKVFIHISDGDHLVVYDHIDGTVIAEHPLHHGKGKLIQATEHTRDRTKGIQAYIANLSEQFNDVKLAREYLEVVRNNYPRYIRDQLQVITRVITNLEPSVRDLALKEAVKRKLFSASEFSDVVEYTKRYRQVNSINHSKKIQIKPVFSLNHSVLAAKPSIHEFKEYLAVLEGESV